MTQSSDHNEQWVCSVMCVTEKAKITEAVFNLLNAVFTMTYQWKTPAKAEQSKHLIVLHVASERAHVSYSSYV